MLAIEISSSGPPRVLKPVERARPSVGPGEILIEVRAAGVARADLLQRQGHYPPPPGASDIPGLDVAGVVEELAQDVAGFSRGQNVCAILAGGGYAEFCAVPASQVLPMPQNWSHVESGSLPENIFTAFDNLITRAALRAGETTLIHGGTSGVGSMAIMLASTIGASVIATAGSDRKRAACLEFGAGHAINYRTADFVEQTRKLTGGRGVEVILDLVGGPYLARNLEALAIEGRLAIVSTQGGRTGELNLGQLMTKRASIGGSTMRARTPEQKGRVATALLQEIWPLLPAKQSVRPVIDSVFPLRDAARAHARMESGEHIGKILLQV